MVTVSDAKWNRVVFGYQPDVQGLIAGNPFFRVREVTFGAAENYVAGGIAHSLKTSSNTVMAFGFGVGDKGHTAMYNTTNNKIQVFSTAGELADASQDARGETFAMVIIEGRL